MFREGARKEFDHVRILRLQGLEEGLNKGRGSIPMIYVYLHGTNHEENLGVPGSGCLRFPMRPIELHDWIP